MRNITRTTDQFKKELNAINPNIQILGEYTGSHNKILCHCKVCGHEWETIPKTLLKGIGCPPCAIRKNAERASEKAKLKFLELTESDKCRAQMIGKWINYETKTLFKCKDCGNEWETSPHSIANNRGCPKCGIERRTKIRRKTQEEFLEEIKKVNPETEVLGEYINDKTKIKCKCKVCGNLFEMIPNHLLRGHGCNVCTSSLGEKIIVRILNRYNISYNAQQNFPKEELNGLTVHVDFFTGSAVIEYNGKQHYEAIEYFGGPDQLIKQQHRDEIVKDFCKRAGYDFIEIPYTANTEELIEDYLLNVIKEGEMNNILIARDAKSKIRVVELRGYWEEELHGFVIDRTTYQFGGKKSQQPFIIITEGKAKRSPLQQFELQYNSELKKYLDKGYKNIKDLGIEQLTLETAEEALPNENTDQNGVLKPMLAKKYQDASPKLLENEWYASRKINGVRCFLFWDGNGIKTVSRGATNYDVPTTHLRTHPKLIAFFKQYPNIILDGELFKFGLTLNVISGLCRKQQWEDAMGQLEFYMYDIADLNKPFVARYNTILKIQEILGLGFAPEREWTDSDLKIQVVPHELISGAENIKKLHDKYVSEGWEGLVIRDKVTPYKPGARGNFMLKYKAYLDKEYLTVGLQEGLRREDFTFIMETESGNRFNAKPIGSREIKEQYRANLNNIIGKMATVKYFEMSGAGTDIPQQPIWLGVRECE